jgi:hypothetical protein
LPKAALGYAFAKEEIYKIIAWMEKFAAFLKAEAYQSSTAVRNLFRDNGQLHEYYHFNRSKSKNKKVGCCLNHLYFIRLLSNDALLLGCFQNVPPFNLLVALDATRHALPNSMKWFTLSLSKMLLGLVPKM